MHTTLSNESFQVNNMGANLAGKIPSLSSNFASSTLIKGIKLAAPAYSTFPHILVSFFVKSSQIIKISHKDPIIDVFQQMHVFNINPHFLKEWYNFTVLIRFDIKSVFVTTMRLASCKSLIDIWNDYLAFLTDLQRQ